MSCRVALHPVLKLHPYLRSSWAARVAQRFTTLRELALLTVTLLITLPTFSQTQLPKEVGTTVNGFQDDFNGSTLDTNWIAAGANVFSVSNGSLHVTPATGDPNHLLYQLPGYDNTVQEVLARVRVLSFGSGDLVRGGQDSLSWAAENG